MKPTLLVFILAFIHCYESIAQIIVTGPNCVVPATVYQYVVSATWETSAQVQICINGGVIATTNDDCYSGQPIKLIKVKWNNTAAGAITVQSSGEQTTTFSVDITHGLLGGAIDSTSLVQFIQSFAVPNTIQCAEASGGGCDTNYFYQWQTSPDNKAWSNIDGANGADLEFTSPLDAPAYYRRKTVERNSDNESYSNVATILLMSFN